MDYRHLFAPVPTPRAPMPVDYNDAEVSGEGSSDCVGGRRRRRGACSLPAAEDPDDNIKRHFVNSVTSHVTLKSLSTPLTDS